MEEDEGGRAEKSKTNPKKRGGGGRGESSKRPITFRIGPWSIYGKDLYRRSRSEGGLTLHREEEEEGKRTRVNANQRGIMRLALSMVGVLLGRVFSDSDASTSHRRFHFPHQPYPKAEEEVSLAFIMVFHIHDIKNDSHYHQGH